MLEFISIVPWTMLADMGNVIILYFFFKKFLFHRVQAVLDKRLISTNKVYEEAEAVKSEAHALREEYEGLLKDARTDAEELLQKATKAAKEKSDAMISLAQRDAAHFLAKAEEEIKQKKANVTKELKKETTEVAILLASKILEREIQETDHHRLIMETVQSAGDGL